MLRSLKKILLHVVRFTLLFNLTLPALQEPKSTSNVRNVHNRMLVLTSLTNAIEIANLGTSTSQFD